MKLLLALMTLAAPVISAPLAMAKASTPSRALWLWDSSIIKDGDSVTKFISVATKKDYKINRVHALINRDIDNKVWSNFISRCSASGIAVEALMGDAQWVLGKSSPNCDTLEQQLDWVQQYQKSAAAGAKLSGLHMDVEPWGLPGWTSNTATLISSLLSIASKVTAVGRSLNIPTAADIPFWAYTVKCQYGTLDACLIDQVDSVTLMTYRNTATDLIGIATPALESMEKANSAGKPVWLAVETSPKAAEASLISYASKGITSLVNDLATVEKSAASKSGSFRGIAIHAYQEFLALGA
ncbi:hypothetical protein B0J11DRAFT_208247 [Dendryphion nanum]|uniref:Uncharacterized protein n=1 Tax=Dendryphion nanum TaxID=256645 RepID=A0A9P9CZU9_9PLEO|nr:hypothetical protein B0J11DRAFT_208247 [Dendryphion nanum]